jgi:hypothetical protein
VVPPIACRLFEYDAPFVADGKLEVLIVSGATATTIESETDFVCAGLPASVAVAVKLDVPIVVGVPEIRPVEEDRERPAGRAPAVMDHA